jgi:ribosomal protein L37AE/L43A
MTCIHCGARLTRKDAQVDARFGDTPPCPSCGKPGVYRARTSLGSVVYCQGVCGGGAHNLLHFDVWTPDELRSIADDLEEQQCLGELYYPDGSGSGKAGRGPAEAGSG